MSDVLIPRTSPGLSTTVGEKNLITANVRSCKYALSYCIYMTFVCTLFCVSLLWANYSIFAMASQSNSSSIEFTLHLEESFYGLNNRSEDFCGLNNLIEFTLHLEEGFYGLNNRSLATGYIILTIYMLPLMYLCAYTGTTKTLAIFNAIYCCHTAPRTIGLKVQHLNNRQNSE
ncbi:AGAP009410-PA-like protein [Anopheles sinensis]|uniref:AGAP009410-PA-like protein n=1 Tax=Anopheles sinensis TaxID=74873 RepID=A0A084WJ93_ANOSI|nr:AGAP009410-PA-like protein [Anopheles sinensis]